MHNRYRWLKDCYNISRGYNLVIKQLKEALYEFITWNDGLIKC